MDPYAPPHCISLEGKAIANHAGKKAIRQPSVPIGGELGARLRENWRRVIRAGMARPRRRARFPEV